LEWVLVEQVRMELVPATESGEDHADPLDHWIR
jgi:hypothetical protein